MKMKKKAHGMKMKMKMNEKNFVSEQKIK